MGISSRDVVEDKAFKLKNQLEELKSKEYYSEKPKELVALLDTVIEQTIKNIDDIDSKDQIAIKRISNLLSFYHLCLDEIEHIKEDNVPVEILPLLGNILKKFNVKTTFIFRPNPDYNYSYYPLGKLIAEIMKSQKYPEAEHDVAVISFPCAEKSSTLLNCSFSHEVGHHLNELYSIANDIEPKILELLDKTYLSKYVSKFLESLSQSKKAVGSAEITLDKFYPKEQLVPMFTEEFANIIRKWLDEIVSDIIGLYLFGPAFIFALAEFSLSMQDVEKYAESHPPLFLRLKNLMELYIELDLNKELDKYPQVKRRIEYYNEIAKKSFETPTENRQTIRNIILERGTVSLFKLARETVERKLNPSREIYDIEDCEAAVLLFRNLIPGNELLLEDKTTRPINPISIINAAWIVRINFIDELYKLLQKNDHPSVRAILDQLTLKALELQEFHRRMV